MAPATKKVAWSIKFGTATKKWKQKIFFSSPLGFGCGITLGTPISITRNNKNQKTRKKHPYGGLGRTAKFYILSNPKTGIKQIEQLMTYLALLRSRRELQSGNFFSSFPIVNKVSAPLATPSDSGKKGNQLFCGRWPNWRPCKQLQFSLSAAVERV